MSEPEGAADWLTLLGDYGDAPQRLAQARVVNWSLTNFDTVARTAAEEGYIKPQDVRRLLAFRDDPADESWITGGGNE